MKIFEKIYAGGRWIVPASTLTTDVIDPSTEEIIGRVPLCNAEDIDSAVKAARDAFPAWADRPLPDRVDYLRRIAAAMKARSKEIGACIAQEMGMPLKLAKMIQAGLPIGTMEGYADIAEKFPFEETVGNSLIIREPAGVCGFITPWNYPLHQIVGKVAPALAAGCTMVLKPSEVAPLNAFLLAEIIHEVGLPAGVFNLVSGEGPIVGEALASHPEVDMVSFTGSTRAGIRVAELAAPTVKRVTQELGGKSANIILDDADFENAVAKGVQDCYLNSGQTCSALTRMLVPEERMEEAAAVARAAAERFTPGPAMERGTRLGPLVSHAQRERVRYYIKKGIEEGARLITGGPEAPENLPAGYFVKPTVFADVKPEMTIAREEIFGPVLSIMSYQDEDHAVSLANNSEYGLSGSVWSSDVERAKKVARRLRTGQVYINGGRHNPLAPFGGYKKSGNGREFGTHGLEEFLEVKAMQL
ncbi:MAG: aldehyde dehydrogenase family protein [Acidobacteriota bacterium]|nr:aldehyde dehydrogenase family protein [Acidobacteriota bacterium]